MALTQKRLEYIRKWKAENRDHVNAREKQWREENSEKVSQYRKLYKESDHGAKVIKLQNQRYYSDMPLSVRKNRILNCAKQNAKKKNREFSITVNDLVWPIFCPVLGIELNYGKPTNGKFSPDTPSIDRTDPSKGYVKGNCVVMSWRANRIKTDASLNELGRLISYLTKEESQNG